MKAQTEKTKKTVKSRKVAAVKEPKKTTTKKLSAAKAVKQSKSKIVKKTESEFLGYLKIEHSKKPYSNNSFSANSSLPEIKISKTTNTPVVIAETQSQTVSPKPVTTRADVVQIYKIQCAKIALSSGELRQYFIDEVIDFVDDKREFSKKAVLKSLTYLNNQKKASKKRKVFKSISRFVFEVLDITVL